MNHSDLVLAISPCGELQPSPRLVAEACRGGGIAVLDLGDGEPGRLAALRQAASWSARNIGVRLSADCLIRPAAVREASGDRVDVVVLSAAAGGDMAEVTGWARVLVEVTSKAEARAAVAAGASGLIARGAESGGRVGELTTFVLLQQLVADEEVTLPVWAAGGIGPRTAAACVLGGAAGVVLDSQLALMPESDLPDDVLAILRWMDGSETTVSEGLRGVRAPGAQPGRRAGELLLVGQDGGQAVPFARRWAGTAAAVRGVRSAIVDALEDPRASQLLVDGAPLAASLGLRVPVAQGPMTRVSDEAAFAAAVADNGGLPFIALALADRERSAQMLGAARALLGGRPWGVGILGFAGEELRAAQVEVVRETRPSCVIIAGGHPAHAAALEKEGIPAFLHVPSPKLLRQFLQAGARRFVFEGAECGGHVGPRSSFALWEAQLDVLEEFLDAAPSPQAASGIQVWFAGGIHDARSAAMVAALAAPLCRRGVQAGLLMGTAYLFTREAVTASAIQPLFQRKALAATGTALLETAPGQSIRCLASPYVAEFGQRRADMADAGLDSREIWQRLELMSIGRLRLASKGREHDGSQVDEGTASAQGMYMAGQVAVLRDSPTTIAELHLDVTTRADRFYREQCARRAPARATVEERCAPLDIAVIGMACAFPGAADADGFWDMILAATDAIGDVPEGRWDPAARTPPRRGRAKGSDFATTGAFLEPLPIDPVGLGIPPGVLGRIDPAQLIALEIARRTLIDAGYPYNAPRADHARTGVVFGAQGGSELEQAITLRGLLPAYLGTLPDELDEQLPKITKDTFPGLLANVIAGRIANRLDLGGPNFIVDAACAASLAAIDVACKNLATGAADLMLCGGVDLHNSLLDFLMFDSVHALSPGGRLRAFDAGADGTTLGEGVGCVALKRLADARRDGDRIYAVIAGVGAASDGRTTSLTAPHSAGQVRALRRAYQQAGVRPSQVGLVEAHGTGTATGDEVELASLTSYFTDEGAQPGSCVLGSVKSQVGHTKGAAGMAGMIKAALSVYHGVQPPAVNLAQPHPRWDPERSPFCFLARPRPWAAPAPSRVAAVSAIGFGGATFHVVLKGTADSPAPRHGRRAWPAELFCFHGRDRAAAHRVAAELAARLPGDRGAPQQQAAAQLRTLAAQLVAQRGSRAEPVQLAVVARSTDELQGLLRRALAGEHDPAAGLIQPPEPPPAQPPGVAVLFPGQGSQRPGALADLFVHFAEMRAYLEACPDVASVLFPAAAFDAAGQREAARLLRRTSCAQPALGVSGVAVHHLLRLLGVRPDMMAGHSYGELVALCCAGAYDASALLELSHQRAAAIVSVLGAAPGTMAAVRGTAEEISAVLSGAGLAGEVVLANYNAPRQVAISGPAPAIASAVAVLREARLSCTELPVACAFHSPVLAGAGDRFADALAAQPVRGPRVPVWSNRTAAPYPNGARPVRAELAAQIESPVRFAAQIEAMYEAGARVFIEAGPGQVLTGLVGEILSGRPHLAVACDARPAEAIRGFLVTLGQLACAGVPVNTGWLLRGRIPADPPAARERESRWYVDGALVRDSAGVAARGSLTPTGNVKRWKMPAYGSDNKSPSTEDLLAEYLRLSREAVLAHRDVMLTALGGAPGLRPAVHLLEAEAGAAVGVQPSRVLPAPAAAPPPAPAPAASPAPAPAPARPAALDLPGLVVATICESTGYPPDIVDPDLDLEAELGIDSIKRAEVAGEIAVKLGISGDAEDFEIGDLIKARTVRSIVAWLAEQAGGARGDAAGDQAPQPAATPTATAAQEDGFDAPPAPPSRLLPKLVTASLAPGSPQIVAGARFLITGDTEVGEALAAALRELGALPHAWRPGSRENPDLTDADGLIVLDGLAGSAGAGPVALFPVIKAALRGDERPAGKELRWLLAASFEEKPESAGLAGLMRTVDFEYPRAGARYVALDRAAPAAEAAGWLLAELLSDVAGPVVSYRDGVRYAGELAPADLTLGTEDCSDAAAVRALGLDQDSVVVVVGGARGIAAGVARALASGSGCRIELLGRTALAADDAEAPDVAAAAGLPALRAALSARGTLPPAEVSRQAAGIAAQREVRATMAELRSLGSSVAYQSVDIRDEDATRQAVGDIRARHGRVDGLVFAAGVIEDKLIAEKTPESFARVFDTKVAGARAVLNALDAHGCEPRFTALFGSLAAYGSRGQADYAAANDALEALGASWSSRSGRRCVTVHWGPWAPVGAHAGMVTPGLARQFLKQGIGLIDPDEGVRCLLRELAWGAPSITAVAYVAAPQKTPGSAPAPDGGPR
jgi:acyl transferase domain-containing protein/NAD(P)H-dependent flavin oxidoreductase YrpB (nitropropane dioxygenase family)/NAD(P)-dependent dehydrogenase (short-subunit alcohol dehydrogenase family)